MRNLAAISVIALVLSNVSCEALLPPPHTPENPFAEGELPSLESLPFRAPEEEGMWQLFVAATDGSDRFPVPVTRAPGVQDTSVSCSL